MFYQYIICFITDVGIEVVVSPKIVLWQWQWGGNQMHPTHTTHGTTKPASIVLWVSPRAWKTTTRRVPAAKTSAVTGPETATSKVTAIAATLTPVDYVTYQLPPHPLATPPWGDQSNGTMKRGARRGITAQSRPTYGSAQAPMRKTGPNTTMDSRPKPPRPMVQGRIQRGQLPRVQSLDYRLPGVGRHMSPQSGL